MHIKSLGGRYLLVLFLCWMAAYVPIKTLDAYFYKPRVKVLHQVPLGQGEALFQGEGLGYKGMIEVTVKLKDQAILEVNISRTVDDPEYIKDIENQLIPAIIETQSFDVPVVSGATYSSEGLIEGVKDAMSKKEVSQ